MLPSKFGVNWPFGSGEEAKNIFSRWRPWRPSWISDRHDFSYFWSTSHPDASYQVSSQLAQGCRRSRLLKQLLTPHDGRRTTDNGHWLTTIAHHEHFVLRWANKHSRFVTFFNFIQVHTSFSYISKKTIVSHSVMYHLFWGTVKHILGGHFVLVLLAIWAKTAKIKFCGYSIFCKYSVTYIWKYGCTKI